MHESERLLQSTTRDLVERFIAPRAAAIDAEGEFPWDVVGVYREHGLLGVSIPEEFGGGGLSLFEMGLVYQKIARACLTSSVTLSDQKLGSDPLVRGGSDALRQRLLPGIAGGDQLIAFALTEAGAGSDILSMQTSAVRRAGPYVLQGRKLFITNGSVADLYTVFARTDVDQARKSISCFVISKDAPGVSVGRLERKMGLRGSPTAELIFEDCVVPDDCLVGNEGDGVTLALSAMDPARIVVAFQAVGLAEGAFEYAGQYVAGRVQFKQPIIDFQAVQFMLADMAIQIDAARYLTHAAARAYDAGEPEAARLASEAKTLRQIPPCM